MMITRVAISVFVSMVLLSFGRVTARADLYSLRTSGTISSSSEASLPSGTPFQFELTYNAAAPDLAPGDPTFGSFANSSVPPALVFMHYQAGGYEVTLNDAEDFGAPSNMIITFTSISAIDINIDEPTLFPHLSGGPVSFHADFNAFASPPIFTSDGLPTNTAITAANFGESAVTLLPVAGVVTGSVLTSFSISPVQQPTIAGDYNNNGVVDAADYVVWRDNVGTTNALVNDNGIGGTVGKLQYDLWRAHFGLHFAGGANVNVGNEVPEASAITVVMLAVAGGIFRRRTLTHRGEFRAT